MKRFEDKVVAITGGARGIGKAAAERFASEGARVAVLDIDEAEAQQSAAAFDGLALLCDVASKESQRTAVQTVIDIWGRVDVMVANAGIYRGAPLVELALDDWQRVLDIDLTGVMLSCQAVAPVMVEQKAGSIIAISSIAGKTSWPATAAYSAAKTGVIGLVRSIAQELGPYNINCNAVCLGHADTEMLRAVDARICEEEGWEPGTYLKQRIDDNPMKRLGTLGEVAGLIAYLASSEARYINGQAIEIDGGLVMS